MKRNLFLSLILLPLPLAAEAVSGHFSSHNGGVTALPNEKTSSLTLSGSQSYSDCVANGQGGVFAVLAEGSLTLKTESGELMEFADNRDCAVSSPSGVGFRGIPNDVYLGSGAELIVDTAADSKVIMRSGISADNGASVTKNGAGTWTLAGTAEASRFRGYLYLNEGTLALGEGCILGTPSAASTLVLSSELQLQEGAALGFRMVFLEQSGSITGTMHTFDESYLMVNGKGFTINGDMELAGGGILFMGGSLTVNGDIRSYADTAWEINPFYYRSGESYEMLTCTGGLEASDIAFNLPTDSRTIYKTETQGNTIVLHVSGTEAKDLTWQGGKGQVWHVSTDVQAWTDDEGTAEAFYNNDKANFTQNGSVAIAGTVRPSYVRVDIDKSLTFTVDKKLGGGIDGGNTALDKTGSGTLTLNNANSYGGGTNLDGGAIKATGDTSFGSGEIRITAGTLDMGGKAIANDLIIEGKALVKSGTKYTGVLTVEGNVLKGSAINLAHTAELVGGILDGVLSGTAGAVVSGDVTFNAKNTYKGSTTIQAGGHLTLGDKGAVAGNISVLGGTFSVTAPKGLTLAKNQTLMLQGGTVSGLVTIGAGSTMAVNGGCLETVPVLKGGTLDLGGAGALTLAGAKAQVIISDKTVDLPGKGIVRTDETLAVNSGTVTVNAVSCYTKGIAVENDATLKLASKEAVSNAITVSGNAAVVNGKMHFGNITVNGTLAKGTNITIADGKTVQLNGTGVMLGTIAGAGTVDVNASIDATAAKITAAHINLNNGTFTNTKGIKLAKGQTLTLGGASLDLGPKGALATAAGSTLVVSGPTSLTGSLTLGGGDLVFAGGTLDVDGMLTLSKAMTVKGSGSITYTTLKPFKGDISVLFGGAEVVQEGNTLTITGEEAVGYRLAPAPLDMTPALSPAPVTNPVAEAMVQADWGIIDANRAFMGAVNSRHQHAALLDKGTGAAWVSAFGSSVRHGNHGMHHGSDGNIEGAAFGLEHAVSESGSLGLAVGRSKNRLAATGVTHLRQETAHVALYGQKHLTHGFTADAAAAYGDTETKLGAASWTQKSAALTARLTHAQQLTDATAFRTFGGLAYEATDAGSIGSAHTGSVQNLRAELGAGITHTAGKAHLYAEAALTGDMVRHNPTADLDGTRTHGANPGRIGLRATVGGLYEFTDTWSGTASYGIETESRSTSHTFNVGVSKSF